MNGRRPRRNSRRPPRVTVPDRCTNGKRSYRDQGAAERAIDELRVHALRTGKPLPKRAYECEACDGWHITQLSREAFERVTRGAP